MSILRRSRGGFRFRRGSLGFPVGSTVSEVALRYLVLLAVCCMSIFWRPAKVRAEDATVSLCASALENSLIADASSLYGDLCTIDQNQFCEWLVVGFSGKSENCIDGKYNNGIDWYIEVVRINSSDLIEFAIEIVGPSQRMSKYKEAGFERHKIRFYLVVGLGGAPFSIPLFHDPRYNRSREFENAIEQGNPNNRIFENGNTIETLYVLFQRAVAQGLADHIRG